MMRVEAIVEGHGDEDAGRILITRFLHERGLDDVDVHTMRVRKGNMLVDYDKARPSGIEHYVTTARAYNPVAILILLDADDTCIKRQHQRQPPLGPWLEERAALVCSDTLVRVVVANREYEAWFLNAWHLMFPEAGHTAMAAAEDRPGCKAAVSKRMNTRYEPHVHQARLTSRLPFEPALGNSSRSFRRLLKVLEEIAQRVART